MAISSIKLWWSMVCIPKLFLIKFWIFANIWRKEDNWWNLKIQIFVIFNIFLISKKKCFHFLENLSKSKMFTFKLSENLHFVAFFIDLFSERLTEPPRQESPIHYEFSPAEFPVKAEPEFPTSPLNGTKRRSADLDLTCKFIKIKKIILVTLKFI